MLYANALNSSLALLHQIVPEAPLPPRVESEQDLFLVTQFLDIVCSIHNPSKRTTATNRDHQDLTNDVDERVLQHLQAMEAAITTHRR